MTNEAQESLGASRRRNDRTAIFCFFNRLLVAEV